MLLLSFLVLTLLSSELLAQSRPVSGSFYQGSTLNSRYTFAYDVHGDPESVTVHIDPEGSALAISSDFVRMHGWYRNHAHPLFPEFYPRTVVNLGVIDGVLDTVSINRRTLGPFGLTCWTETYRESASENISLHLEYSYTEQGHQKIVRSLSGRYVNDELIEVISESNDTAILEYSNDKLLSYFSPKTNQKQIYSYRADGTLLRVEQVNLSLPEPRTEWIIDDIQTRRFEHWIDEPSFSPQIYALVNEPVTSATVRQWSEQLQALDTAMPYSASFDDLGRIIFRMFENHLFNAAFAEEGFQKDVTTTVRGDTIEYRHRDIIMDNDKIISMHDTLVGISIIDGMLQRRSRDYVFEYGPATVRPHSTNGSSIVASWNSDSRSITVASSGETLHSAKLYSVAGSLIASFSENDLRSQLHQPLLTPGVYLLQVTSAR